LCQAIGENSRPAASTANGAVPAGSISRRCRVHQARVPASTASPATLPTGVGRPSRAASPGSEALASTSGTPSLSAMPSHVSVLDGPAASAPTAVAPAAASSPVRSDTQRRCTNASSSTGASDGLSATVTPWHAAASTGRPRRSATHPATNPTSSSP